MTDFTMQTDAEGVATITWDVPGKSMNVLSMDGAAELNNLIDDALADAAVKGIVITSGKADFAAGMDLNVLATLKEAGAEAVSQVRGETDPRPGVAPVVDRDHDAGN